MIQGEMLFKINLPYQVTQYENLKKLAVHYTWWAGSSIWIFKYSHLKQVETILGIPITIPGFRDIFEKEDVNVPNFKGKDILEIQEFPKIYQIIEHRKQEDGTIKTTKHMLPKDVVDKIWREVIRHKSLNKKIKTRTIAEGICKIFNIDRFSRDSGTFDFAKFFGNRSDYYRLFYLPAKVLHYQGKIKHYKSGFVERLK